MENVPNIFTRKNKGEFTIIHLDGKNFDHVDCQFTESFTYEHGPNWNLVDNKGNTNVVSYKMDLKDPAMTEGWAHLWHFYNLQGDQYTSFQYIGGNTFHTIVFKGRCKKMTLKKYFGFYVRRNTKYFPRQIDQVSGQRNFLGFATMFVNIISNLFFMENSTELSAKYSFGINQRNLPESVKDGRNFVLIICCGKETMFTLRLTMKT